jgi:uncharacterized membrane protein YeaQ/YmgE (transglycosylase-associated protein family)
MMGLCPREHSINSFIWCAVGGLLGAAAGLASRAERIVILENIGVGVFGAFIGGDFLVAMFSGLVKGDTDFHVASLGMAAGGAVFMLFVLRLMRGAVGPIRASRKAGQRRS